jgi:pilus assembly protein Flp/PilA
MKKSFKQTFHQFILDESGPTAVEYAIMLALIIIVCIASIGLVGQNTNQLFETSGTEIQQINSSL